MEGLPNHPFVEKAGRTTVDKDRLHSRRAKEIEAAFLEYLQGLQSRIVSELKKSSKPTLIKHPGHDDQSVHDPRGGKGGSDGDELIGSARKTFVANIGQIAQNSDATVEETVHYVNRWN